MMTAKVFKNGRSQAIRLPMECRFSSDEVMVKRIGDIVILVPKQNKWESFMICSQMILWKTKEQEIWFRSVKHYEVYA